MRIEATVATLAPELKTIAPVRSWQMGREEEIAYAREHGIPVKGGTEVAPYSIDDNLWGRSSEGRWIEDLDHAPEDDVFQLVTRPEEAPDEAEIVTVGFEAGVPVSLDGERLGLVDLLERAAEIGCRHGVGIVDHIEDRIVGLKVRDIYEVPAAAILLTAHQELEKLVGTIHQNQFKPALDQKWGYLVYAGLWWEPLRTDLDAYMDAVNAQVTGEIGLKLYKGSVRVVTRSSPNAVYDADLASFAESGGLFSQTASPGFIELWSLQSRMAHRIRQARGRGGGLMYDTLGKAAIRFALSTCAGATAARSASASASPRSRSAIAAYLADAATSPRAEPVLRKFRCGLSSTCERSLTESASLARFMPRRPRQRQGTSDAWPHSRASPAPACCVAAPPAAAADALQAKVEAARSQASALAAELQANAEPARRRRAAGRRGRRPRARSSAGCWRRQRNAPPQLAGKVSRTRRRLVAERGRLRRARAALSQRLVAIYESGSPSAASVVLASADFDELATRADYLQAIEQLRHRPRGAGRAGPRHGAPRAGAVAALKARADAYDERLAAARSQIPPCARAPSRRRPAAVDRRRPRGLARQLKSNIGAGSARSRQRRPRRRKRPVRPQPKKPSNAGSAAPTRSPPTS